MENIMSWMQKPGFLKSQLSHAVDRLHTYFSTNLPTDDEATQNGDILVAAMLTGFAILKYAIQQQIPQSNHEAERQDKAVKSLTLIVKKDLAKSEYSDEILIDIFGSRTFGDVAYDRLIRLFRLVGMRDEKKIASVIPSFLAWTRDEVEYFRNELPRAGRTESISKNGELDLATKLSEKTQPRKPSKRIGRGPSAITSAVPH